ncbi:MAG: L,D-transpeptidase family protein [Clostridia bacterium]|nr:L,D-transpeptidase family protein [Clostridia bacterium]
MRCRVALGRCPHGRKRQEGDGRTPEGVYTICLVKEQGKYGRSLGLSYPNRQDADLALQESRIDLSTHQVILERLAAGLRPPWGSPLGGEVYIHEGGVASDWTQGCIALESSDMDKLFPHWENIRQVEILP